MSEKEFLASVNRIEDFRFDVEGESGKLEVIFEEPAPAKFVISPNTPVREIWILALSKNGFVLEKTSEGQDFTHNLKRITYC